MEVFNIKEEYNKCLKGYSKDCYKQIINKVLEVETEENASMLLANFLLEEYITWRADDSVDLMKEIFNKNMNLAYVRFPDNYLYRAIMYTGSYKLFECYMEDFARVFLKQNPQIDKREFVAKLNEVAKQYDKKILDESKPIEAGFDFEEAYGVPENDDHAVLLDVDTYNLFYKIVEKYNAILGRIKIKESLKDYFEYGL